MADSKVPPQNGEDEETVDELVVATHSLRDGAVAVDEVRTTFVADLDGNELSVAVLRTRGLEVEMVLAVPVAADADLPPLALMALGDLVEQEQDRDLTLAMPHFARFLDFGADDLPLGSVEFSGAAFAPAEPIPHVCPPPGAHVQVILLTPGEVAMAAVAGTMRVLARIGKLSGHYPFPPWSDLERASAYPRGAADKSTLNGKLGIRVPGVRVRLAEGDGKVILRVPRNRAADLAAELEMCDRSEPAAVLSSYDFESNAVLTWHPDNAGRHSAGAGQGISGAGGAESDWVGASFLLILCDQAMDTTRLSEDGFVVMLSAGSWMVFKQVLAAAQPFGVGSDLEGGLNLFVEYADEAIEVPGFGSLPPVAGMPATGAETIASMAGLDGGDAKR